MPLDAMERQLNAQHAPYFEAIAINGKGVMETLTMCCKMVLKQIQDKSNVTQTTPEKGTAQERTTAEQTETELPHITLVESQADAEKIDDRQHVSQGNGLSATVPETSLQETADHNFPSEDEADRLEAVESDDSREISFREEPFLQKPEEHQLGNELLEKEPAIDLIEPELQLNDVIEDRSLASNDQTVQREEITTSPDDASPGGTSPRELKTEEGKRTCPRCSLKFNPNVKQCPICKVSLLPGAGEQEPAGAEGDLSRDTALKGEELLNQETAESFAEHDGDHNGKPLEIVACGQPEKTAPTAIRVPIVIKINETEKEIEVDLAISFGNVLLK
jgi:hypothetical protein